MEYDITNIKKTNNLKFIKQEFWNEKHNVRVAFVENTVWPVKRK